MSSEKAPHFPDPFHHDHHSAPPPGYAPAAPPASGFRIALTSTAGISKADLERSGPAPCHDLDRSPIYLGSALFMHNDGVTTKAVHPCKIGPHLQPTPCSVAYGGREVMHHGRYDLLIFDGDTMEWVPTSHGRIPEGRIPIEGGYEENVQQKLYHARGRVENLLVPGKTGHHLGACHVSFGGGEHAIKEHYEILCWKLQNRY